MTLNTRKFKNQLSDNLTTPITNYFQKDINNIKFLLGSLKQLQSSVQHLQGATKGVSHYLDSAKHDVEQWQFKSQPRLEKIQQIIDKMK